MFSSKSFNKLKNINKFFFNLEDQPSEKSTIRGKKHKKSINFKREKSIVPAIAFYNDKTVDKKNNFVSFSNYCNIKLLSFFTDNLEKLKNRIVKIKSDKIVHVKQRVSDRYSPAPSDNIQFIIPSINRTYKPINIGIRELCIVSDEKLINYGIKFTQCILKADDNIFYFNCIIRNSLNDPNGNWNYSMELSFTDPLSFFNYFEWVYSLFQPNIYTPSRISVDNLKICYKNTRSTLTAKDDTRINDISKEIESWDQQNQIGRFHCNIAYVQNEKLVSACSTKRIYENTFLAQRLICIPGLHLYDKPKLKLYESLSEILLNHPACGYLMMYKSRDIEWHERFFQEVVNHAKDPSDINFTRLNFVDIAINTEESEYVKNIENSIKIKPLLDYSEFIDFVKQVLPVIVKNSYNYLQFQNDANRISDLLNAAGTSMVRKIYKITKQDKIVAFAVCEVDNEGYLINNSLDLCRIYYCTDIKNDSELLDGIINELSLFYATHQKTRFRILWENQKVDVKKIVVRNSKYKGTLLRLIVSKRGLNSLHQVAHFSEGKFTKYYHLSYPQQGILSRDYLSPGSSINVISCTIHYKEKINFILLGQAINEVIRLYDSIRIQISNHHHWPCQYISPFKRINISLIDFTKKPDKNRFMHFEKKWSEDPFVLFNSQLFKFKMFYYSDVDSGFFIKMHHIIADAWSIGIITDKIKEIYDSLNKNVPVNFNYPPSYTEYLKKDFEYRFSTKIEKSKHYWLSSFRASSSISNFNQEQRISSIGASKRKTFIIDTYLVKDIMEYVTDSKLSTFSFFLSCLYVYLHKISNENNFVIGTSILNRSGKIEKSTTGLFVSNLPILVHIDGNISFRQFAGRVAMTIKNILRHQKFPYELLLQEIKKSEIGFKNPYSIAFTYQNYKLTPNYSLKWNPYHCQNEHLNIHLNDWESNNRFELDYDYQTSVFSDMDITRMHELVINIILDTLKHPKNQIDKTSLVSQKEADQIQHTFNKTSMSYPTDKTIHALFEKQVRKTPDNIAVIENGKKITYNHLNSEANILARFLLSIHTKSQNEFLGILINNSIYQIIAQVGILKSGNAFVPIDTDLPEARVKTMIDDAKIKTLITINKYNDMAFKLQSECSSLSHCVFMDDLETYIPKNHREQSPHDSNINLPLASSSLAYAIFTSGTSGKPKGVMIEHKSVVNLCCWYSKYYAISENDNIGLYIPQSFDPSVAERFSSLISGATAHIIPYDIRQNPQLLNDFITDKNISVIIIPTPFYNYFKHYDNKSLRVLIVGGDKLSEFIKKSYKVYNNYGPTENTVITTVFPIDKNYKNIPIGKPIANTRVYILDKNNNVAPVGISGELCISGDGLSRGYINNIDSDKFVDNPFESGVKMYRTGDIARWLPDGNIEYIGRKDNQIKLRGFRIELEEIEAVLLQYPSIVRAVVILKENADEKKVLIVFYEADNEISHVNIIDFLSRKLPNYMIPSHFIHLPSIPLLISGKIDRKQLLKISDEKLLPAIKENCFKSNIDKKLYEILKKISIEDEITKDTNFAEMGGDSLKAIEISNQIEEEFQIKFPIRFLLDNPKFTDLTNFIEKQIYTLNSRIS